MADRDTDVVVIGGGLNGLVAAARLAREGLEVQVLERRERLGGSAGWSPLELTDGGVRHAPDGLTELGQLNADIVDTLELERYGLDLRETPALAQSPAGAVLDIDAASGLAEWVSPHLAELSSLLLAPGGLEQSAQLALRPRLLAALSATLESVGSRFFDDPVQRALLSGLALEATGSGPPDSGGGLLLLCRLLDARGGLRRASQLAGSFDSGVGALARAAVDAGVQVRLGVGVGRLDVQDGQVVGVATEGGETVSARVTVSTLDARATLLGLVGAGCLPLSWVRRLLRGLRRTTEPRRDEMSFGPPSDLGAMKKMFDPGQIAKLFDPERMKEVPSAFGPAC